MGYSDKQGVEKETLFDKARRRSLHKNNWRVNESSNCWFINSIRTLSLRTTFPTRDGRALKTTRGRTQFTEEQRKFLTKQFPVEEGRGKKADPQPAGYRKECEESGKRWVLVYSVEKPPAAAGGRFLLKNSNEDTKNVSDMERRK